MRATIVGKTESISNDRPEYIGWQTKLPQFRQVEETRNQITIHKDENIRSKQISKVNRDKHVSQKSEINFVIHKLTFI